jgi:hypothetical protein
MDEDRKREEENLNKRIKEQRKKFARLAGLPS